MEEQIAQQKEAVHQAFRTYLDTWLGRRDAAAVHALNGPLLHGFGTGADESVYDPAGARATIEQDIRQVPEPFQYTVHSAKVTPLCHDVALVLDHLRLTLVFRYLDGAWLLEHLHSSFPAIDPGGEPARPLQRLEDRAVDLQRLVWERSREQEAARQCQEQDGCLDDLTGLIKPGRMRDVLQREVARRGAEAGALAVILLDIDHLKAVNEAHGFEAGDRVLSGIADVLRSRVRITDALARWGGGAFLLACPMTDGREAEYLGRALRRAVSERDFDLGFPLTASVGVTAAQAGDTVQALVQRAERALQQAKQVGGNVVQMACPEASLEI